MKNSTPAERALCFEVLCWCGYGDLSRLVDTPNQQTHPGSAPLSSSITSTGADIETESILLARNDHPLSA